MGPLPRPLLSLGRGRYSKQQTDRVERWQGVPCLTAGYLYFFYHTTGGYFLRQISETSEPKFKTQSRKIKFVDVGSLFGILFTQFGKIEIQKIMGKNEDELCPPSPG